MAAPKPSWWRSNHTDYENPFKFTGMELDPTTGLYDHGARQRNPIHLNWLNPDPLMEKYPGVSPWSYCHANPVRLIDPTGCEDEESIFNKVLSFFPKEIATQCRETVNILKQDENFSWENVAIGVENSIGFSTSSGVKGESSGICGNVIFLGGEDAGYVYTYYGGEVGVGGESSVGASGNIGVSIFVAYNKDGKGGHGSFDGSYQYYNFSVGGKTEGIELGMCGSTKYAQGVSWDVFSISLDGMAGARISTCITMGGSYGKGNIHFQNKESVGTHKSALQKISSYWKIYSPLF
ncbi:MAG: RHS repeat-associated core domain-containing protein [Bacteroidales bacterium]|nr:RHS repeat-associated core domain-containing protein [Bacteroidales bacterium]